MKKLTIMLITASFIVLPLYSTEYSFVKEFKVATPANLKISTSGGNIGTTGYSKDVVEVSFIVKQRGRLLDVTFEELEKMVDLDIINESDYLEISVKNKLGSNISVGFEIKTPFMTSCNFSTSGGNIKLAGLNGKHSINTSGGNLAFENITGNVNANTSGGNISITGSKANFETRTSGGNVDVENVSGKVETHSSGGNIKVKNSKYGVIAETSGGNIDLSEVQGDIDLNTSGGHISLQNISGSVKAITSGGDISANLLKIDEKLLLETSGGDINATVPSGLGLNLDLSAYRVHTNLANFTGKAEKDRVVGEMNGGGAMVHLSTSGGTVSLDYK